MLVNAVGLEGIDGYVIEVAVKILGGVSVMNIIGLGDQAIKEAKDRIESVMCHYDFQYPKGKIVVNLAPCDLKKSGSYLDLAMIIALMTVTNQVMPKDFDHKGTVFLGTLGLSGELIGFRGVLAMVLYAKRVGFKQVILPKACLLEAQACKGIDLIGFETVYEVIKWLEKRLIYSHNDVSQSLDTEQAARVLDYSQVVGQDEVLHYVLAAAAGGHNLLLIGPPGCGKSMIAKRLPTILPDLSECEALEVMSIHSIMGLDIKSTMLRKRPFRAPHYNASANAIIGGGSNATPGEVSLAHHGVLFLDELPEYAVGVIDALRQPLEDGVVTVARVKHTNTFPANFMFVGAMNPCKCGYHGYPECTCSAHDVKKYQRRISGPVYDRIDIQRFMGPVPVDEKAKVNPITSQEMKAKVLKARAIQEERFRDVEGVYANADMKDDLVVRYCQMTSSASEYLETMLRRFRMSRRAYDKVLIVARTFADLEGAPIINLNAIQSALMARDLDREGTSHER